MYVNRTDRSSARHKKSIYVLDQESSHTAEGLPILAKCLWPVELLENGTIGDRAIPVVVVRVLSSF